MGWKDRREPDVLNGVLVKYIDDCNDAILITTEDGRQFKFFHDQDCCESVRIWDTKGDLKSLQGKRIVSVEQEESGENPSDVIPPEWQDSFTWTNIVFRTDENTVIVRWYGDSNGYYSERVNLDEITND